MANNKDIEFEDLVKMYDNIKEENKKIGNGGSNVTTFKGRTTMVKGEVGKPPDEDELLAELGIKKTNDELGFELTDKALEANNEAIERFEKGVCYDCQENEKYCGKYKNDCEAKMLNINPYEPTTQKIKRVQRNITLFD